MAANAFDALIKGASSLSCAADKKKQKTMREKIVFVPPNPTADSRVYLPPTVKTFVAKNTLPQKSLPLPRGSLAMKWTDSKVEWRVIDKLVVFPVRLVTNGVDPRIGTLSPLPVHAIATMLGGNPATLDVRRTLPDHGEHFVMPDGSFVVNQMQASTLPFFLAALRPFNDSTTRPRPLFVDDGSLHAQETLRLPPIHTRAMPPSAHNGRSAIVAVTIGATKTPAWDVCATLMGVDISSLESRPFDTTTARGATCATLAMCAENFRSEPLATAFLVFATVGAALRKRVPNSSRGPLRLRGHMPIAASRTMFIECGPFVDEAPFIGIVEAAVQSVDCNGTCEANPLRDRRVLQMEIVAWFNDGDDTLFGVPAGHFQAANQCESRGKFAAYLDANVVGVDMRPACSSTVAEFSTVTACNNVVVIGEYGTFATPMRTIVTLNSLHRPTRNEPMHALASALVLLAANHVAAALPTKTSVVETVVVSSRAPNVVDTVNIVFRVEFKGAATNPRHARYRDPLRDNDAAEDEDEDEEGHSSSLVVVRTPQSSTAETHKGKGKGKEPSVEGKGHKRPREKGGGTTGYATFTLAFRVEAAIPGVMSLSWALRNGDDHDKPLPMDSAVTLAVGDAGGKCDDLKLATVLKAMERVPLLEKHAELARRIAKESIHQ